MRQAGLRSRTTRHSDLVGLGLRQVDLVLRHAEPVGDHLRITRRVPCPCDRVPADWPTALGEPARAGPRPEKLAMLEL
jgi:hypothetical protein